MEKLYFNVPKKEMPRAEKLLSRTDISVMQLSKLLKESMKRYKTPTARLNWIEKQLPKKEIS